jgi:hypothetical protein
MPRCFSWTLLAATSLVVGASVGAQTPTHVYTLNNTLMDARGGPSLAANGGGFSSVGGRDGYAFGPNEGPSLSGALNPNVYSIELLFSLADVSTWRKIVDFKDRTSDRGAYATYNPLINAPGAYIFTGATGYSGAVFFPNVLAHLVLTRDATNTVSSYVNGVHLASFDDAGADPPFSATFTGPGGIVHFFRDDLTSPGATESTSGFVDYVRLYGRPLSAAEVAGRYADRLNELADVSSVPEPGAVALVGSGLATLATAVLLRRKR